MSGWGGGGRHGAPFNFKNKNGGWRALVIKLISVVCVLHLFCIQFSTMLIDWQGCGFDLVSNDLMWCLYGFIKVNIAKCIRR